MGIRKKTSNLWLFRPFSLFTFGICYRFPILARLERTVIKIALRKLIRDIRKRGKRPIVFISKNQQYYIADLIKADLICYSITDEYYTNPYEKSIDKNSKRYQRARASEMILRQNADITFASSRNLYESRKNIFKNIRHIPNSADFDHFRRAQDNSTVIPDELTAIPGRKIGYIGNINELIDLDLISELAGFNEDWSIVLIGSENGQDKFRKSSHYLRLKSREQVYFLGRKPYDQLPEYLKGIDVCLLPFVSNAWMENSSPNKIFQYLAAGKPVVSTDFPAVRELESVVEIAPDLQGFIDRVEICLIHDDEQKKSERMEIASRFSIDRHADLIIQAVAESLSGSRRASRD